MATVYFSNSPYIHTYTVTQHQLNTAWGIAEHFTANTLYLMTHDSMVSVLCMYTVKHTKLKGLYSCKLRITTNITVNGLIKTKDTSCSTHDNMYTPWVR